MSRAQGGRGCTCMSSLSLRTSPCQKPILAPALSIQYWRLGLGGLGLRWRAALAKPKDQMILGMVFRGLENIPEVITDRVTRRFIIQNYFMPCSPWVYHLPSEDSVNNSGFQIPSLAYRWQQRNERHEDMNQTSLITFLFVQQRTLIKHKSFLRQILNVWWSTKRWLSRKFIQRPDRPSDQIVNEISSLFQLSVIPPA